jgi:acyl-CoA thioester hydrolase
VKVLVKKNCSKAIKLLVGASIIYSSMDLFRYYCPITVRYADLDPQGHVNNARYLTYIEQARMGYMLELGLWDRKSFLDIGIILAEARITYRAPILLGQAVQVGVRVVRIGSKSLDMAYVLVDKDSEGVLAQASTILVAYDYRQARSINVPPDWRSAIQQFEGLEVGPTVNTSPQTQEDA